MINRRRHDPSLSRRYWQRETLRHYTHARTRAHTCTYYFVYRSNLAVGRIHEYYIYLYVGTRLSLRISQRLRPSYIREFTLRDDDDDDDDDLSISVVLLPCVRVVSAYTRPLSGPLTPSIPSLIKLSPSTRESYYTNE